MGVHITTEAGVMFELGELLICTCDGVFAWHQDPYTTYTTPLKIDADATVLFRGASLLVVGDSNEWYTQVLSEKGQVWVTSVGLEKA